MPKAKQILNPKLKSSRHRRVRAFRLRVIARRRSRRGNLMHGHRAGQQITTSPFGLLVMTSALGHRPCWDSHRVLHLGVIARRRSRRGNLMHGHQQARRSPRRPSVLLVMTSALGHRSCKDSHRVIHVIARRRSRRGNLMHGHRTGQQITTSPFGLLVMT